MEDLGVERPSELASPVPPSAAAVGALAVFQSIAAAAGIIAALKTIFQNNQLDEQLDEVLTRLHEVKLELMRATADILEAIDGIHRQIDQNTAEDNITRARVALFNDLAIFGDKQAAMTRSFEGADRLVQERDASFASSFMFVVNIRLAVVKDFDPNYFCNVQFVEEFKRYMARLDGWIAAINALIARSHVAGVVELIRITPSGQEIVLGWEGTHRRNGLVVRRRRVQNTSEAARDRLQEEMNGSRAAGITADRRQFGVLEMERTVREWRRAFDTNRRMALVEQVLSRSRMASDADPDGLLVDGRILPDGLDFRSTLFELLMSREFRGRVELTWSAFVERGEDRLMQFAHQRLFDRAATSDEVTVLRSVAAAYGYGAVISALLYSEEYQERYGGGIPAAASPVIDALAAGGDPGPD